MPFAGAESDADIQFLVKIITDLKADQWIAYIFGGASIAYGLRERKLRQKYMNENTERERRLEEKIDPERSSSGLPETGETGPTD